MNLKTVRYFSTSTETCQTTLHKKDVNRLLGSKDGIKNKRRDVK